MDLKAYFDKMRGGKTCPPRAPWHEIFWSAFGTFVAIFAIYMIGHLHDLKLEDSLFLVGSFGATAVLLYAIPLSPFAQPRNLIVGHIMSAIVGVSCVLAMPDNTALAAATSVAVAVAVMHLTRSLHPPGGATALIAVIGSEHIHEMGYWYVISPIGLGVAIMLIVALIINNLSPHRRYPQYWC